MTATHTPAELNQPSAKPDRTASGRFAKGNTGGPGNPFGRRLAQFRQALLSAVTEEQMRRLGDMLIEKALSGDLAAAKLLLQYAVGKPQVVAEPDRLDIDEWELARQSVVPADLAEETFASLPIAVGIATLPALAQVRQQQFADMMLHPENYPADADEPTPDELADDALMLREYRTTQAAEANVGRKLAAESKPVAAQSAEPVATSPAEEVSPAGGNGERAASPRPPAAAKPRQPRTTNAVPKQSAAAPLPNGTNGASRRRPPARSAAPHANARVAG